MSFLLMLGTLLVGSFALVDGADDSSDEDMIASSHEDELIEDEQDMMLDIALFEEESVEEAHIEAADAEEEFVVEEQVEAGEWLTGGNGADDLTGTNGDDSIFGGEGADTIEGGAGDDALFSGNDASYSDDWNHYPGELTRVDDAGDVLNGGAGNDELWLGQGTVATGGEGDDLFHVFGATYPQGADAAEITDFTAGEDQLEIDFPVHEGYYTEDFTTEDAINGLLSSYDEETDTTVIEIDGEEVVAMNGDQTDLSIAFYDDVSGSGAPVWLDVEGNAMTAEDGEAADIILCARALQDVIGEIS
ncbi:Hemolysin, chromosomal [Thalassovita gelatinovora]|uniref:Hemolysin, chromosomal n=1 Tax=Thalassovita gelatinovora TaxID=53501 RepID=A0A0P1FPY2_THAGE|nr:hypothetical protein [Thalassovita gelatinovora]QIZ80865.1 hypothetical protein HFZ77_10465 [Thalassovita gelatinovora]CUH63316.1 Hemolysin, chromosomal [Thalassovita gelatinovora]SEQ65077.1 hypothetical protein SAMN04488043_107101 [Thalassovita gelatinovora]